MLVIPGSETEGNLSESLVLLYCEKNIEFLSGVGGVFLSVPMSGCL